MENDRKIESRPVETYAEDMAQVLENDKEGLVKKIIHGEAEHEMEKRNLSPQSRKNRIFLVAGFLLLFAALAILTFFILHRTSPTVPVVAQFTPIIFNSQMVFLEVSGMDAKEITQNILKEITNNKVKTGGVEGIYLTENQKIIGLRRFIALTQSHFVPGDNQLFIKDNFLMGVADNSFFLLLKMRSTPDIFPAMRDWEKNMLADLHEFIGVDITSGTSYLFKKDFTDGLIANKNARILYDNSGNVVLSYIFADDNDIVITASPAAAREIMLELASAQIKQ